MDTIMQWTDGMTTAVATLAFAATFLAGIWAAAKFGKITAIPSLIAVGATFYLRLQLPALSMVAIGSMCALHLAAGCLLGLLLKRNKKFGPPPSA